MTGWLVRAGAVLIGGGLLACAGSAGDAGADSFAPPTPEEAGSSPPHYEGRVNASSVLRGPRLREFEALPRAERDRIWSQMEQIKGAGAFLVCQYTARDGDLIHEYMFWRRKPTPAEDLRAVSENHPLLWLQGDRFRSCPKTHAEAAGKGYYATPQIKEVGYWALHEDPSHFEPKLRERMRAQIGGFEVMRCRYAARKDGKARSYSYHYWFREGPSETDKAAYLRLTSDHPMLKIDQVRDTCPPSRAEARRLAALAVPGRRRFSKREQNLVADGGVLQVPGDYSEPSPEEIRLAAMRAFAAHERAPVLDTYTVHNTEPWDAILVLRLAGIDADQVGMYERFLHVDKQECTPAETGAGYTCRYRLYTRSEADEPTRKLFDQLTSLGRGFNRGSGLVQGLLGAQFDLIEQSVNNTYRSCHAFSNRLVLTEGGWHSPTERARLEDVEEALELRDQYQYLQNVCPHPYAPGFDRRRCRQLRSRLGGRTAPEVPKGEKCTWKAPPDEVLEALRPEPATTGSDIEWSLSEGLLAHFTFDGGAEDVSGKGRAAEVEGAKLVEDREGRPESAYAFDGKDDVIELGYLGLSPRYDFSITFWLYNKDTSRKSRILELRRDLRLFFFTENDKFRFWDRRGRYAFGNLQEDTWVQYAIVYDHAADQLRFYENGRFRGGHPIDLRSGSRGEHSRIGHPRLAPRAIIDDLRVYNRALSESSLRKLYQLERGAVAATDEATADTEEAHAEATQEARQAEQAASAAEAGAPQGNGQCAPRPEGLVSWWRAEGSAADVQGSNDGSMRNGAGFAAGYVGQAFSLDGVDDHIRIRHTWVLNNVKEISAEAWVNAADAEHARNIFREKQPFGFSAYRMSARDGRQRRWYILETNPRPPTNTWVHVAAVFDHGLMQLYVNGALAAERRMTGSFLHGRDYNVWAIGGRARRANSVDQTFAGLIDEVSLYNRALTAGEIQAIYRAGTAGKCP